MKPLLKTLTVAALCSCITTLHSTSAFAQSEFDMRPSRKAMLKREEFATPSFYLAPQHGSAVETGYTRGQVSIETNEANSVGILPDRKSYDRESNIFTTAGAVAINRNIYLGLKADYGLFKNTTRYQVAAGSDDKIEGVGEPTFTLGGRLNSGMISGLAQLDYKIGIGERQRNMENLGSYESDAKQGGGAIVPSIAVFSNQKDSIVLGGELKYTIEQDKTVVFRNKTMGTESRSTFSGGNTLTATAFLETSQLTTAGLGVAAAYSSTEPTRDKAAVVNDTVKGSETATVMGYGVIRPMDQLTILPLAGFTYYLNNKYQGFDIKNQSAFVGMINARLAF